MLWNRLFICELWIFFFEQKDFVLTNLKKKTKREKKYQYVTAREKKNLRNNGKINEHQQSIEMNNEFIWRTMKILLLRHF